MCVSHFRAEKGIGSPGCERGQLGTLFYRKSFFSFAEVKKQSQICKRRAVAVPHAGEGI